MLRESNRFERELRTLAMREYEVPLPTTSIVVKEVRATWTSQKNLGPLPSGARYEAFYFEPLPGVGNTIVRIKAQLLVEDATTKKFRVPTEKEYNRLKPHGATAAARAGGTSGIASSTSPEVKVAKDGTFETETYLASDGTTRRFLMDLAVDLKGGGKAQVVLVLQRLELDPWLALVDAAEAKRPPKQTHLEFVASLRKIYQGGPGDPFEGPFQQILYRHRNVTVLHKPGTVEHARFKRFQLLWIGKEAVDISHVLTGIEGSDAQDPSKGQGRMGLPVGRDALVTWGGDLGNALAAYIVKFVKAFDKGDPVDIADDLRVQASRSDLIGDIDGINIGAVYDGTKTLKENLTAYYGSGSKTRFKTFVRVANIAIDGKKRVTKDGRLAIAGRVTHYVGLKFFGNGYLDTLAKDKADLARSAYDHTSAEVALVVDFFVDFLERGLAKE